jgi:hypothetical protein
MSVRQLMAYHSIILLHKTLSTKAPEYPYKKVTAGGQFSYKTRQAAECPTEFSLSVRYSNNKGQSGKLEVTSWVFPIMAGAGRL